MNIKTLADLKRYLVVGVKLSMVKNDFRGRSASDFLPWSREVVRVQTNGVWFIDPTGKNQALKKDGTPRPSYLDFPKASNIRFDERGFSIIAHCQKDDGAIEEIGEMRYEFTTN